MQNRLTMGRARQLCYAMNAKRRMRENGEEERRSGVMPLLARGIRPVVLRFQQLDGFWEENFNFNYMAKPFLQLHYRRQPHSLPHCLAAGFGHVAPNAWFPLRLNCLPLHAPDPPHYVPPPPPPPQDQDSKTESSSSESEDSEDGNFLKANCGTP